MCYGAEAAWIPAVVAAVGAGASAYNTRETAKDQDQAAAAGIRQQAARQAEADQAVSKQVSELEASTPEAERAKATNEFLSQLRVNRGNAVQDSGTLGASSRFTSDIGGVKKDVKGFGTRAADIMGRIAAPARQRQNEQTAFGRVGTRLNQIKGGMDSDAFLMQLRQRGITRNPWIDAGGQVASGIASGMAGQYDPDASDPVQYVGVSNAKRIPGY